ncbi:MAG: ATP-binding cassette domain-containing protein [Proteobacteria bacterium]|nr:ATP-binding cassette domain-containing protein [Pseudomonadota bacterium]MBU4294537.1 ATP-binding cassette domain-containing protein [Pseudomonadota bacterium]MCG2747073.1 ATP-binding cassette domain-containing protein [Desulfobulbaceae bacterium]
MTQKNIAVEVTGITRKFGEFTAVDNISFQVSEGQIFGFLGTNGAGKTTLIRMLTTLLRPTSGQARVAGFDVTADPDQVRRSIGVVPQSLTSDLDLTGYENMDIYGRFYNISARERRERIPHLLELVGLSAWADHMVASYSGGMRRRLELARVLVHRPRILFLDEPTIGLDPQSRRVVWDFIRTLRQGDAMTLFLTTHYMDEAEALCERVAIIDSGKLIAIGSPDELKARIPGSDIVTLKVPQLTNDTVEQIGKIPFVHSVTMEENTLRAYVDNGAENLPLLIETIKADGLRVVSATLHEQSLEDVFIHFTGKSIREETKKVNFLIGAGIPQKWGR